MTACACTPVSLWTLSELPHAPPRAVYLSALLGDDADRAVDLEDRGVDGGEVREAVLACRHLDLIGLDVLAFEVLVDELAVLHEQRRLLAYELAEKRPAGARPVGQ